nr:3-oxoacyl-ACP reductase FabG [uncultured Bacteroides sp.]
MKYALVTGGSRGIGRAICCKLSSMGYYILINYQSNENEAMATLEKVRQLGSDGELLKFNVADSAEVKQVLDQWNAGHSGEYIEVLVNNAGIRKDNLMIWMPEDDWHNVVNTGLDGFFFVTQSLLKNMLIRKYGRIINIVSLSGIKGMPGQVNYSAAKGGIIAAAKALSQEVARKNVTVNAVAPGFISTDMTHDLNESELKKVVPMGRFGKAEEVADLVGFLASEQAAYITGEVISINGGL